MLFGWLLTVSGFWVSDAPASEVPLPLAVTAEESAQLVAGEIVVRDGGAGLVVGVMDVRAPTAVLLEEVLNVPARSAEVGPLQEVTVYEQSSSTLGVRMEVGMFGLNATFHVAYQIDRAQGWCTFHLDEDKENDISSTDGSYQVYASGGSSRLVYRSEASADAATPAWLREILTSRSMRQQMEGIRARAESRGGE